MQDMQSSIDAPLGAPRARSSKLMRSDHADTSIGMGMGRGEGEKVRPARTSLLRTQGRTLTDLSPCKKPRGDDVITELAKMPTAPPRAR